MILTGLDRAHHHSMPIARPDTVSRCVTALRSPRHNDGANLRYLAFRSQTALERPDIYRISVSSAPSESDVSTPRGCWNT